MTETDTTFDAMMKQAEDLTIHDLGNPVERTAPEEKTEAKIEAKAPAPAKAAAEPAKEPASKVSAAKVVEGQTAKAEAPKDNVSQDDKQAKAEERKNRTWTEINAEKERIAKEKAELEKARQEWQKTKATTEAYRDEHGYSAKDYKDVAKTFLAQGKVDEAAQAEKIAAGLEQKETQVRQERHTEELKSAWSKNYSELCDKHPDLSDQNSELFKAAQKTLQEFPLLQQSPDGLKYAVKAALIDIERAEFEGTKAEYKALQEKHEKLQKKLSIQGGSPTGAPAVDKSFREMSANEKYQKLEQSMKDIDRENGFSD